MVSSLQHLPIDVQAYLADLRDGLLLAISADEVLQIFLVGSASYPSGYIPGQSDLDIAVITRSYLAPAELARVPELCSHAAIPCPADKLELVVYAYDAVHLEKSDLPYDISLNYNTGQSLPKDHVRYGNNPDDSSHWFILDIAAARSNHVALLDGPAFADIFTPALSRGQLLGALKTSLDWHIANEPTSCNAVLNACRGWRWAQEGVSGSKLESGEYALDDMTEPDDWDSEETRKSGQAKRAVEMAVDMREGMTSPGQLNAADVQILYRRISAEIQSALTRDV